LDKAKTTALKDMLAAIETEDGWLNAIIDKVSNEPERQAAIKVIGQNPAAWGKVTIKEIREHFLSNPSASNPVIEALIQDCKISQPTLQNPLGILIDYFKNQDLSKSPDDTTLKEFLEKK
jgi:hypothetical protein